MATGSSPSHQLQWADYAVLGTVLLFSLTIGLYHGCKKKTTTNNTINDYLLGNRRLRWLPVGLSILVTYQSAVLFTGLPGEVYTYGISFVFFNCGQTIAVLVVVFFIIPLLFPLRLTSTYEYLERRFKSRAVRMLGSVIGALNTVLYIGVCMYLPAIAMTAVSGIPVWVTIVTLSLVATLYTTLGGMKAVIWTDVFQFVIMMSGILAIIIEGFREGGGVKGVLEISDVGKRLHMPGFSVDPRARHTVWSLVCGGTFAWLATIGVTQGTVQRFSSVPSMRDAKMALLMTIPGFTVWTIFACAIGLIIYAYYHISGCDPITSDVIKNPNQLSTLYVAEVFKSLPGFTGLFVASIFSAALSTASSGINGLSAMMWEDILQWKFGQTSERLRVRIIRMCAFLYGLLGMAVGFLVLQFGGPATQIVISLAGASGGPLFGMFLLGCLFPWANKVGVAVGAISSVSVSLWIAINSFKIKPSVPLPPAPVYACQQFGTNLTTVANTTETFTQCATCVYETVTLDGMGTVTNEVVTSSSVLTSIYSISYLWLPVIGVLMVIIVGLVVSFITGPTQIEEIDPQLLSSVTKRLAECCRTKTPSSNKQNGCQKVSTEIAPLQKPEEDLLLTQL